MVLAVVRLGDRLRSRFVACDPRIWTTLGLKKDEVALERDFTKGDDALGCWMGEPVRSGPPDYVH